jgi:hypothetical protein
LSCAQDKEVRVWLTQLSILVDTFQKGEEPLCLESIREECQLLLGTESGNILTHDIVEYIDFHLENWPDVEKKMEEKHRITQERL